MRYLSLLSPLCQVGLFTDLLPFKEKGHSGRLCAAVLLKRKLSRNLMRMGDSESVTPHLGASTRQM